MHRYTRLHDSQRNKNNKPWWWVLGPAIRIHTLELQQDARKLRFKNELQPYWSSRDNIAITDGITMKGRIIVVPASLENKALNHLQLNQMGIEKKRLLACESFYWVNINANIEETVEIALHALIFMPNSQRTKQFHTRYKEDHGNLYELICFQLITSIIFVL